MTMLYGNLADAALGESRFIGGRQQCRPAARLKPVTQLILALALALVGMIALAALDGAPDRFAAATPSVADLEDWLIGRDLRLF